MDETLIKIGLSGLSGLFGLLWWFIKSKDTARQNEIDALRTRYDHELEELWSLHKEDAARLQSFEVQVARNYYESTELDVRFDKFERTFSASIDKLERTFSASIGKLAEKIDHLIERGVRG